MPSGSKSKKKGTSDHLSPHPSSSLIRKNLKRPFVEQSNTVSAVLRKSEFSSGPSSVAPSEYWDLFTLHNSLVDFHAFQDAPLYGSILCHYSNSDFFNSAIKSELATPDSFIKFEEEEEEEEEEEGDSSLPIFRLLFRPLFNLNLSWIILPYKWISILRLWA
ncbi:uncharacterized protein N7529_009443 [Penicillium soppii]|uniref:uncharacterized protein n=1 Tax=Penicillium soppii TaxID=69789 RepID=UPI002549A3FF|nr:uncharacterized protein N7529_009443 [Penicillium soppii]KAJ5855499.1 hypothetical protein N7529_009443 [Penicillium soppii]